MAGRKPCSTDFPASLLKLQKNQACPKMGDLKGLAEHMQEGGVAELGASGSRGALLSWGASSNRWEGLAERRELGVLGDLGDLAERRVLGGLGQPRSLGRPRSGGGRQCNRRVAAVGSVTKHYYSETCNTRAGDEKSMYALHAEQAASSNPERCNPHMSKPRDGLTDSDCLQETKDAKQPRPDAARHQGGQLLQCAGGDHEPGAHHPIDQTLCVRA